MSATLPASERDQQALWAVLAANVAWKTVDYKALAENLEHVLGLQSSLHPNRQTFESSSMASIPCRSFVRRSLLRMDR
jgi:hypothetical protein